MLGGYGQCSAAIALCCCGLLTAAATGQETERPEINWLSDPAIAAQIARQHRIPILVYVTSDNCTFCRKMERSCWTDSTVVDAVIGHYVALKLTPQRHRALVQRFNVQSFPTTILLTSDLKFHDGAAGYLSAQELTRLLRRTPSSVARANPEP